MRKQVIEIRVKLPVRTEQETFNHHNYAPPSIYNSIKALKACVPGHIPLPRQIPFDSDGQNRMVSTDTGQRWLAWG
jgi:hypothetical protein